MKFFALIMLTCEDSRKVKGRILSKIRLPKLFYDLRVFNVMTMKVPQFKSDFFNKNE